MRYFKEKQFQKDIIVVANGYYCRFSLSYRDVSVHPTTIMRWAYTGLSTSETRNQ